LMRAFDVSAADVVAALEGANENVSAGILVRADEESIVQGIGRIASTEDIESTVVALRGQRPVRVGDLGAVHIGAALRRGTAAAARRTADGTPIVEPAVVFGI